MAAVPERGDQLSTTQLSLLTATDLLRQERSSVHCFTARTGIKSIDTHLRDLFSGGKVIGLGQVHDDDPPSLATQLIVSTLLPIADSMSDSRPEVFIIAPPTTTTVSNIHSLLCKALKTQPSVLGQSAESSAFDRLNSVQLLQYLDLPGLAESLSEVSERIFNSTQISDVVDINDTRHASHKEVAGGSVLLIQGLGVILSSSERRSGAVQTSAILSNLLRTVKHLSKIHKHLIILVEIDITSESQAAGEGSHEGCLLDTAFSTSTGVGLRVVPETAVGSALERGMDVVVCVHDGFDIKTEESKARRRDEALGNKTRIVEVVKDKMGGSFGEWCM